MANAGAYGKIPTAGDFVRYRLPREFVNYWDGWMQSWFGAAKAEMGADWSSTYMTAPIWRFTVFPGIVGSAAWLGAIVASVDRVGRQFPLTVAVPLPASADPGAAHFCNDALYDQIEKTMLRVLREDITPGGLAVLLADLPELASVRGCQIGSNVWVAADRFALRANLAARQIQSTGSGSYWSSDDGDRVRFLVSAGLPEPQVSRALFNPAHPIWKSERGSAA